ncbi:MAG: hypothetical protein IIC90_02675 [Chloroflexi bacterium]|nr:hypothetical protein [Chloroflexota bacterium]
MQTDVKTRTITWTGASGSKYQYKIFPIGTTMNDTPGNYIFAKETKPGTFRPIYVGETESLADRLNNPAGHHKWACIKRQGATHICAHVNTRGARARRAEEADLLAALKLPCND